MYNNKQAANFLLFYRDVTVASPLHKMATRNRLAGKTKQGVIKKKLLLILVGKLASQKQK
jgi:hypothetical protein